MLKIGAALEWMPKKCASVRGDSPKKEEESPLPFLAFLTAWQILTFFRRRKGTLVGGIFLTGGGGPISPPESPSPVKEFNGRNEGSFIFSSERPHTAEPLNPFWGWAPCPRGRERKPHSSSPPLAKLNSKANSLRLAWSGARVDLFPDLLSPARRG